MIQLVIEEEGNLQVVNLEQDELEIMIGRKESAQIRLGERNVSRQHAILTKSQNQVFIEDFSRYGTKVNGRRLDEAERVELKHGDEINIGDFRILLEDDEADAAALEAAKAKAESLPEREQPMFVAISSNLAGKEFKITRPEVIIGRAPEGEANITVDDRSISRHHAKVKRTSRNVFTLEDMDSANGIKVRGRPVKEHQLASGDIIELGQVKFRYCEPGEIWFFDPKSFPQDVVKRPPPPPPKSNALVFALAGVVVVGLVVAVVLFMRPSGDASTTQSTSQAAGPVDQGYTDQDKVNALINVEVEQISDLLGQGDLENALRETKEFVEEFPPQDHPSVKQAAAGFADQIAAKHLGAAASAPTPAEALTALAKSSEANNFALKIDPNLEAAKARSTALKGEQDALPKIADAERMLQEARAKSPPDREACKDAAEKLAMLVNSAAPIPITKALAAKSPTPSLLSACVEASYIAEIDALLSAKNTAKAKTLVEEFLKEVPNATAKASAYRSRINSIENPASERPDRPTPDPVDPPPTVDNSAEAAKLATQADDLLLKESGKAIKLYKESLKLKNDGGVRARMADVMSAAGLHCEAAKEYTKLSNAAKAAQAQEKCGK
jgi:pSer/pThr/pTyr-binding forkhead associated (FHA) protein/tetratricopeptide (TPR) repeat protein